MEFSLDIINCICFAKKDKEYVLDVQDWSVCIVVSKKWYRALKIPILRIILEKATKESKQDAGLAAFFNADGIGQLAQLRKWKVAARKWIASIINECGDAEKGLVFKNVQNDIGLGPLDVCDNETFEVILEIAATNPNAYEIFTFLYEMCSRSDMLQFHHSLLLRCVLYSCYKHLEFLATKKKLLMGPAKAELDTSREHTFCRVPTMKFSRNPWKLALINENDEMFELLVKIGNSPFSTFVRLFDVVFRISKFGD